MLTLAHASRSRDMDGDWRAPAPFLSALLPAPASHWAVHTASTSRPRQQAQDLANKQLFIAPSNIDIFSFCLRYLFVAQ